jgi:phosphoribosyl 1,2-cyclic phosphate phosphodiesterase
VPDAQLELLFLGSGTSAGVPMIGCHCPVCSSTDARDKRMRSSVVVSYGDTRVLVDTTPELRLQCVANGVDRIDAIVFTHAHADHIMGLDDVRRFNVTAAGPLDVWADDLTFDSISRCFGYAFARPDPPDGLFRPTLIRRSIDGPFEIAGVRWTPIPLIHGNEPVLGFRIGRLAYCTDVSEVPEASLALLNDLDVLVIDALHHKRHSKHLSLEQAMEISDRVKPAQTLFTHISHGIAHAETNRILPAHMQLSFDGQIVRAGL